MNKAVKTEYRWNVKFNRKKMLLYIKFNFNLIALFYIGTVQEYQFATAKLVWQNWKLVEYFKPL